MVARYGPRGFGKGLVLVLLVGAIAAGSVRAGSSDPGPRPAQAWCSLFEGDGVSSPASEGWNVRTFGGTVITGGSSGGATVAIVDDPTTGDGAWMQRFVDFEPPFELAVRGRHDPAAGGPDWIQMAYVFTGTHALAATYYPDRIVVAGVPSLTFPAIRGTWYNVTFDARAPLDVDVYLDGVRRGNVEMFAANRIIFDAPNNQTTIAAIISGPTTTARGMVDYIRTTMCPPTTVGPKTPDRTPPSVLGPLLDDGMQAPSGDLTVGDGLITRVWLNATIDDTATGGSRIWSANYTRGARAWPASPMSPVDGALDSPREDVTTSIDISTWPIGDYVLCVYGRDYFGNKDLAGGCGTLRVRDLTPPAVLLVSPSEGATGVPAETNVTIVFSEPMDTAATTAAFSMTAAGVDVAGAVRWSGGGTVLVFTPTSRLREGTVYTLRVAASAADGAGNPLPAPKTWSLTTTVPPSRPNWKPVLAGVFAAVLVLAGIAARRNRRALMTGILYAVVEVATGLGSLVIPEFAIPPLLGVGTLLDVGILIVSLVVLYAVARSTPATVPLPPT